eukprot:GHVP01066874.1.p1 GENE.GHVP01066874.1~~GHVP01066874.1.p1  ORF type:complete len:101 (+),score=18.42 GHVP01066874.1:327-629(+)
MHSSDSEKIENFLLERKNDESLICQEVAYFSGFNKDNNTVVIKQIIGYESVVECGNSNEQPIISLCEFPKKNLKDIKFKNIQFSYFLFRPTHMKLKQQAL